MQYVTEEQTETMQDLLLRHPELKDMHKVTVYESLTYLAIYTSKYILNKEEFWGNVRYTKEITFMISRGGHYTKSEMCTMDDPRFPDGCLT